MLGSKDAPGKHPDGHPDGGYWDVHPEAFSRGIFATMTELKHLELKVHLNYSYLDIIIWLFRHHPLRLLL